MTETVCVWCRGKGLMDAGVLGKGKHVTTVPLHQCPDCEGLGMRVNPAPRRWPKR